MPPLSNIWIGVKERFRWFWYEADTQPLLALQGATAFGWALSLWLAPDGFQKKAYAKMALWAPIEVWIIAFSVLAAGMAFTLLFIPFERQRWYLVVKTYSLIIWTALGTSYAFAPYPPAPGGTIYYVLWLGTLWTFLRVGPSR